MKWRLVDGGEDGGPWDAFVERHEKGNVCFLTGFRRVMKETFGYAPLQIAGEEEGRIRCAFIAFGYRNLHFRRRLVSTPMFEFGGPLFEEGLGEADKAEFYAFLREAVRRAGYPYVEMRAALGLDFLPAGEVLEGQFVSQYAVLPMEGDPERIWSNVIRQEARKAVNKARREGLVCGQENGEETIADVFYPMYLRWMRDRHGSPPLPQGFFLNCRRFLGDRMRFFVVRLAGTPLAVLLGFCCGKRVYISNVAFTGEHADKRPNDLAHWMFVRWACEEGYRYFDFGNARYEGQIHFKKKWGCEFQDYFVYHLRVDSGVRVDPPVDPEGVGVAVLRTLWKRLVPLSAARALGPAIRKRIAT